ncbi:hypothetical protein ACJMK2_028262 [Sinanodonta woodiana]|uniref:exodeoxyribonuclease III n=1 Tax=Sinanodonta woodiana TaxID=1069815 RepID=A0ABD3X6J8_SINWO
MPPKRSTRVEKDAGEPKQKRTRKDVEEGAEKKDEEKSVTEEKKEDTSPSTSEIEEITSRTETADGRSPNIKIASWNINGIRAWVKKDGMSYLKNEKPDILCVQEVKCDEEQIPKEVKVDGYYTYFYGGDKPGYAGTGIFSKKKPISIKKGLGIDKHDDEGRVITAEYDKFYLVTTYVPNSGRGLPRLPYRTKEWDVDFSQYLQSLDKKKPVVMCGDLNVAHEEIDLANPKTNKKTAGFTNEERAEFTKLLSSGFIDSFRTLYPKQEGAYTFWSSMGNARAKNVGWRLDYFVLSKRLEKDLCDSMIRKTVMGSDHCPIVLTMAL